uniref:Uncharacterized protein n=1 Tax=Rhizophora mucronata TaxID=61149 RepID=A0A2P2MVY5_RHIMU
MHVLIMEGLQRHVQNGSRDIIQHRVVNMIQEMEFPMCQIQLHVASCLLKF